MNSIIIPVYNQSKYTDSILNQIKDFDGEIIVVNDGSTDNTLEILSKYPKVKVITNEKNSGFAKSVNNGYRASKGDKIMFLNNDVKFTGKTMTDIDSFFKLVKDNYLLGPTGGFVNPKTFHFEYETDAINKKINYLSGWCLSSTRNTFDLFKNPFIEDFGTYFEDTYMGYESLKLKVKFKISRAPFLHYGKVTSSAVNLKSLYLPAKQKFIEKVTSEFTDSERIALGKRSGFE